MPQSLSKVYVHITFSTKKRKNLIDEEIENALYDYLGGICKGLECYPVKVGGYKNHVHILCLLSRKIAQMTLLEEVKKRSSLWIKTKGDKYANFYWQDGYGIFSVNPAEIDIVVKYIENQKEHHEKMPFKVEYLKFLKKYGIEYDERYMWD
jgi:REP element-mobilizing transposase RayT